MSAPLAAAAPINVGVWADGGLSLTASAQDFDGVR